MGGERALRRGASVLPVVALFLLPVLFVLPSVYPWAGDAQAAKHGDVARFYLTNPPSPVAASLPWRFSARWLGAPGASKARRQPGWGFYPYGGTISIVATDWVLSLDPSSSPPPSP